MFIQISGFRQSYSPSANEVWETKNPKDFNIEVQALEKAIEFAQSNEYSCDRDLRYNYGLPNFNNADTYDGTETERLYKNQTVN